MSKRKLEEEELPNLKRRNVVKYYIPLINYSFINDGQNGEIRSTIIYPLEYDKENIEFLKKHAKGKLRVSEKIITVRCDCEEDKYVLFDNERLKFTLDDFKVIERIFLILGHDWPINIGKTFSKEKIKEMIESEESWGDEYWTEEQWWDYEFLEYFN